MKKNFVKVMYLGALLVSAMSYTGCADYDDEINDLQTQVDVIAASLDDLKAKVSAGKWITGTETTSEGFTLTLSDGTILSVKNGEKGEDGKTSVVTMGEDGFWYIDNVKTENPWKGEKGEDGTNGHSPKIEDGFWKFYDDEKEEWVTGPAAEASMYVTPNTGLPSFTLHVFNKDTDKWEDIVLPTACDIREMKSFNTDGGVNAYGEQNKLYTYGAKIEQDFVFNGREYKANDYLSAHTNMLSLQINPANIDFSDSDYKFSLTNSHGEEANITLGKIESLKELVVRDTRSTGGGLYNVPYHINGDITKVNEEWVLSPSPVYAFKTHDANGNVILSDYNITVIRRAFALTSSEDLMINDIELTSAIGAKASSLYEEVNSNAKGRLNLTVDYYFQKENADGSLGEPQKDFELSSSAAATETYWLTYLMLDGKLSRKDTAETRGGLATAGNEPALSEQKGVKITVKYSGEEIPVEGVEKIVVTHELLNPTAGGTKSVFTHTDEAFVLHTVKLPQAFNEKVSKYVAPNTTPNIRITSEEPMVVATEDGIPIIRPALEGVSLQSDTDTYSTTSVDLIWNEAAQAYTFGMKVQLNTINYIYGLVNLTYEDYKLSVPYEISLDQRLLSLAKNEALFLDNEATIWGEVETDAVKYNMFNLMGYMQNGKYTEFPDEVKAAANTFSVFEQIGNVWISNPAAPKTDWTAVTANEEGHVSVTTDAAGFNFRDGRETAEWKYSFYPFGNQRLAPFDASYKLTIESPIATAVRKDYGKMNPLTGEIAAEDIVISTAHQSYDFELNRINWVDPRVDAATAKRIDFYKYIEDANDGVHNDIAKVSLKITGDIANYVCFDYDETPHEEEFVTAGMGSERGVAAIRMSLKNTQEQIAREVTGKVVIGVIDVWGLTSNQELTIKLVPAGI